MKWSVSRDSREKILGTPEFIVFHEIMPDIIDTLPWIFDCSGDSGGYMNSYMNSHIWILVIWIHEMIIWIHRLHEFIYEINIGIHEFLNPHVWIHTYRFWIFTWNIITYVFTDCIWVRQWLLYAPIGMYANMRTM